MLPNLPFNSRLFTRADVWCLLSAPVVVAVGDGGGPTGWDRVQTPVPLATRMMMAHARC